MSVKKLLCIGFTFVFVSCTSVKNNQTWIEGMRGMSESLTQLFPYIYDTARFSNPDNAPFITNQLSRLNFSSDSLDKHIAVGLSGNDPLFDLGLKNLKKNFHTAYEAYNVESYDYAQETLKNAVNYCVKCHMRSNIGRSYVLYDQFSNISEKELSLIERARFFVANRKFDQAKDLLEEEMKSTKSSIKDKMDALKLSLLISLRYENSIVEARKTLKKQVEQKYPKQEKDIIQFWLKTLSQYSDIQKMSLEKALFVNQVDEFSYVDAVLKSYTLHQSLNHVLEKNKRAEIYYSLGKIYATHSSLGFLELPDQYYEACVYEYPFTKVAKKCYFQVEIRLKNSFKVAKGGSLPIKETDHLRKLKALTIEKASSAGGMSGEER